MTLPTTRAALMQAIAEERQRLEQVIASFTDDQLTNARLADGWTPKDMMAHLVFWEASMRDRLRRAASGETVPRFAGTPEESDRVVQEHNEQAYQAWRTRSLVDVRAAFEASYREVLEMLEGFTDAQIFGADGLSRGLGYPAIELIAGDTFEHYKEHGDTMRAIQHS